MRGGHYRVVRELFGSEPVFLLVRIAHSREVCRRSLHGGLESPFQTLG